MNTAQELLADLLKMLPNVESMVAIVCLKDEGVRCAFTNMPMGDLLFLQKILEIEVDKRIAMTFIPDNSDA